jgi:predicted phosphodiesterase
MKKTERSFLAIDYVKKYADRLSKKAIGKILFEENPHVYKDEEDARCAVRYITGARGRHSRQNKDNDRFFSPYPEKQIENKFFDLTQDKAKILLLGDIHVPFHDKRAVDTAFNYGVKHGADVIILNGDTLDHWSESTHEKEYRNRDMAWDYEQYLDFLFEVRCAFPDAKILFKMGNHENRYERALQRSHLRELLGIDYFQYEKVLKFDELGIQKIDEYKTITVGGLNIIHGHEYRGNGGVNPARWLSLRTGESTICGHFHRTSEHSTKSHRGDITSYWSCGTLADLNPRYMAYNGWNHGFAYIIKEGEMFFVKNKRVHDGTIL